MGRLEPYLDEESEKIAREMVSLDRGLYSKTIRAALLKWKAENINDKELGEKILEEEIGMKEKLDHLKKLRNRKKKLEEESRQKSILQIEKKKQAKKDLKREASITFREKLIGCQASLMAYYDINKSAALALSKEYLANHEKNNVPLIAFARGKKLVRVGETSELYDDYRKIKAELMQK